MNDCRHTFGKSPTFILKPSKNYFLMRTWQQNRYQIIHAQNKLNDGKYENSSHSRVLIKSQTHQRWTDTLATELETDKCDPVSFQIIIYGTIKHMWDDHRCLLYVTFVKIFSSSLLNRLNRMWWRRWWTLGPVCEAFISLSVGDWLIFFVFCLCLWSLYFCLSVGLFTVFTGELRT